MESPAFQEQREICEVDTRVSAHGVHTRAHRPGCLSEQSPSPCGSGMRRQDGAGSNGPGCSSTANSRRIARLPWSRKTSERLGPRGISRARRRHPPIAPARSCEAGRRVRGPEGWRGCSAPGERGSRPPGICTQPRQLSRPPRLHILCPHPFPSGSAAEKKHERLNWSLIQLAHT